MQIWSYFANSLSYFNGMQKIHAFKTRDIKEKTIKKAIWNNKKEKDINLFAIYKENYKCYT